MNVTITDKGLVEHDAASSMLPKAFALSQNIPNPFNPTTEIGYALPQASAVHLEIVNVLGQVVRTLADEFQTAGSHKAIWGWPGWQPSGSVIGGVLLPHRGG